MIRLLVHHNGGNDDTIIVSHVTLIWTVQLKIGREPILGALSLNGDVFCYVYDNITRSIQVSN
jgi:hypothetical protein